jgi:hypothetical protein
MEILKDLQAAMEKVDEARQGNRKAELRDPLAMVADGVGALGWVTVESSPKPHEYITELFGGAQMYGNKVLKEYRDKYGISTKSATLPLTFSGRTKSTLSGCKHTTSSSRVSPNTQRNSTLPQLRGTRTA